MNNYIFICKINPIILKLFIQISEELTKLQFVFLNVPKNDPIKRLDKIIEIIGENRDITIYELANKLNVADKTIKRDITKLKEQNRVIRVGSLKSGHWEINHL